MLHYPLDQLGLDDFAFGGAEWAIAWEGEALPDAGAMLILLAASEEKNIGADSSQMKIGGAVQSAFQPERVSGMCAAG